MGLRQADALVALALNVADLAQHQRMHRVRQGAGNVPAGQQFQQCIGPLGHLCAGLAPGQQWPLGSAGLTVAGNGGAHPALQRLGQRCRQRDQAAQGIGFAKHGIGGTVMRAPGVVGQESQCQPEQHADDVDEGRCHARQRPHPGGPAGIAHQPLESDHPHACADHGHQRIEVMVVGLQQFRVHGGSNIES